MRLVDALDTAIEGFGRRLGLVSDARWAAATPCEEWDVHYLAAHVVGGNRFAALVLDGTSADAALRQIISARQLGDAPVDDLLSSAAAQRERFRAEGALQQPVSHPLGDLTAERFLEMRVFDVTLHTWDLARAIGADDALDTGLVTAVLAIVEASNDGMGFGLTSLGHVGPDAPPQDRLLDLTGRATDWQPPST